MHFHCVDNHFKNFSQTISCTVPYAVAIHQTKEFSEINDNYQALSEQVQ